VSATGVPAFRVPAVQPSAAGSRFPQPMAEKLTPELPTPVAVTRHLKLKAAANHPVSGSPLGYYFTACSLWSMGPLGLRASSS